MSENFKDFYYHHLHEDSPWPTGIHSTIPITGDATFPPVNSHPHMIDPFYQPIEYPYANEIFHSIKEEEEKTPSQATPNSSISSSSTEAGDDVSNKGKKERSLKQIVNEDGEESSKKETKAKKGGKKEKQPRFAFMTKSDVDHLEDGYRWRKYGQKAVKNSPYPRSYYRCTTQKCTVKKRVERSYQDPTVVITTYEGQHNHHVPVNLRGNIAGIFGTHPFPIQTPNFASQTMAQTSHPYGYEPGNSYQQQVLSSNLHHHQQQFQQFSDYGLLQDTLPQCAKKSHE